MPATTAPSGTLFKNIEAKIPEIINNTLTNYLPGVDPMFNVIASSERVESTGIGRNLQVKKVYQGNLTGVTQMSQPSNYHALFGGTQASLPSQNIYRNNLITRYPDVTRSVGGSRPVTMTVNIQAMEANLDLTVGEMRADALSATIGEIITPKLMGFVQTLARARCNMFYTTDTTNFSICDMTNIEVGASGDASKLIFTPSNESTLRFYVGMRVDIFFQTSGSGNFAEKLNVSANADTTSTANWLLNANGGTVGTTNGTIDCYVVAVDELSDRVTLQLAAGAWIQGAITNGTARQLATVTGNPARTLRVCLADTKYVAANGEAFSGLNTWIKDGSTGTSASPESIFGVDINQFPQFKSLGISDSGPLTEQKLQRYLSRYTTAREPYGFTIDTLLTTQGVMDAYRATKIGKEEIHRTGPLSLNGEGTASGYSYVHNGKRYSIEISPWCAYGHLYGIKKTGFTRYVPNRTPGAGSQSQMPGYLEFEFIAPLLTGLDSIRLPTIYSSGSATASQYTDTVQMPGDMRMELVPDQLSMLRVTGLSEDKIAGAYPSNYLA